MPVLIKRLISPSRGTIELYFTPSESLATLRRGDEVDLRDASRDEYEVVDRVVHDVQSGDVSYHLKPMHVTAENAETAERRYLAWGFKPVAKENASEQETR